MRNIVLAVFLGFTRHFEGICGWMYLDQHRSHHGVLMPLVTTGYGDLIDPIEKAMDVNWLVKSTGQAATSDERIAEWKRVKSLVHLADKGGYAFRESAVLVLSPDEESRLFYGTLRNFDGILTHRYARWDEWPADAQVFALSLSWAVGPNFETEFPKLETALQAMDFGAAAKEAKMRTDGNGCLDERNTWDVELLDMADNVMSNGLDRAKIWTRDLPGSAGNIA